MVDNKELESGLKAMAEDFYLPGGGHKKLSQLVAGHMHWFDAAKRRGMGWRDMIRALSAAGVNGRGGKPLSVGTLSSTVWRKRAETEDVMSREQRQHFNPASSDGASHATIGTSRRDTSSHISKAVSLAQHEPQRKHVPPP